MRARLLLVLALYSPAWGAAISSNAVTGLWSSTSSWAGGVVPGNGDTANLVDGAIITVNDARIIGTSPASGTTVLTFNTTGQLIIASGGSLNVRGDAVYNSSGTTSAVIVQGGGIWEFDASLATTPLSEHYVYGQSTHFGKRAFEVGGSSGSHGIVRSNAGGGVGSFSVRGFTRGGGFTSNFGDFLRIGDASISGWQLKYDNGGGNDPTYAAWSVTSSTFTNCGLIDTTTTTVVANSIFKHDSNVHTNSLNSSGIISTILNGSVTPGTGILELKNNVFDIPVSNDFQDGGFTFSGNYYSAGMNPTGSGACIARSAEFMRFTSSQLASYMSIHCDLTGSYIFIDADGGNVKPIQNTPNFAVSLRNVINGMGGSGQGGDSGELWWAGGSLPASPLTYGMFNTIMLPDATGHSYQEGGSPTNGAGNVLVQAEHNVWFGGYSPSGAFAFLDYGEGGNTPAGKLTSYRANIIWADSSTNPFFKMYDIGFSGTPTADYCAPANCDYNGAFNFSTTCVLVGCAAYANQGRGYAAKFSSTPGIHDVNADPQFVDYQRTAELYPSKGLGFSRTAWSGGATYAAGDFVSVAQASVYWGLAVNYRYTNDSYEGTACSGANPKPGSGTNWRSCWEWEILYDLRAGVAAGSTIIADMMTWVRAGWTATNPLYNVTFPGDTNAVTSLGAVQWHAAVTCSSIQGACSIPTAASCSIVMNVCGIP